MSRDVLAAGLGPRRQSRVQRWPALVGHRHGRFQPPRRGCLAPLFGCCVRPCARRRRWGHSCRRGLPYWGYSRRRRQAPPHQWRHQIHSHCCGCQVLARHWRHRGRRLAPDQLSPAPQPRQGLGQLKRAVGGRWPPCSLGSRLPPPDLAAAAERLHRLDTNALAHIGPDLAGGRCLVSAPWPGWRR